MRSVTSVSTESERPSSDPLADGLRSHGVHRSELPSLEELLALAPLKPLSKGDLEGWPPKTLALVKRFPGADPDYHRREAAKYECPPFGSPLAAWVASFIYTARAHWSRAVHTGDGWSSQTRLQFRDWLPGYLEQENWFWGWGGMGDAAQLVRLACGLPRFPKRWFFGEK
jgi:hypothetical protein